MTNQSFPFAVRLIGFPEEEAAAFEAIFAAERGKGYSYVCLADDNLQDADLYVVNGTDLKALVRLADLKPSDVRPALLVGQPAVVLPYLFVSRPLEWHAFLKALDGMIESRADKLFRLAASDLVAVPERRRGDRLDLDLTDPADYERMRAKVPKDGLVLVVDKSPALRDYLADLLARLSVPVAWVSSEGEALESCKRKTVAAVMINTSTPGIDPYRLCAALKLANAPFKTAVIFLVSKPFRYDTLRAREAGVEGFLNKPLASHHLVAALKKCLPHLR